MNMLHIHGLNGAAIFKKVKDLGNYADEWA